MVVADQVVLSPDTESAENRLYCSVSAIDRHDHRFNGGDEGFDIDVRCDATFVDVEYDSVEAWCALHQLLPSCQALQSVVPTGEKVIACETDGPQPLIGFMVVMNEVVEGGNAVEAESISSVEDRTCFLVELSARDEDACVGSLFLVTFGNFWLARFGPEAPNPSHAFKSDQVVGAVEKVGVDHVSDLGRKLEEWEIVLGNE